MKPAKPVDPFSGPSLSSRTQATGIVAPQTGTTSLRSRTAPTGIVAPQTNPEVQKRIMRRTAFVPTGAEVIPTLPRPVVAGVSPKSQYDYNMRRMSQGRGVVYPTHLDPLLNSMNYFGGQ